MPSTFEDGLFAVCCIIIGYSAWRMSTFPGFSQPGTGFLYRLVAIYLWIGAIFGVVLFPDFLQRAQIIIAGNALLSGLAFVANQRKAISKFIAARFHK